MASIPSTGGSIYSLYVTDRFIIAGTYESNIHVWDATNYQPIRTLEGWCFFHCTYLLLTLTHGFRTHRDGVCAGLLELPGQGPPLLVVL